MSYIIVKYLTTAALVVIISEVAKINDKLGALMAALPMITLLTLIWMFVEQQPSTKIANHAWYTFWYVLPTLPMFLLFPYLLPKWGFLPTILACLILTLVIFYFYSRGLRTFGIHLL